jgi:hypothetical protein
MYLLNMETQTATYPDRATRWQIANTALHLRYGTARDVASQIGRRAFYMLGNGEQSAITDDEGRHGLRFGIKGMGRGQGNTITVCLDRGSDEYIVSLMHCGERMGEPFAVAKGSIPGVCVESLHAVIEELTSLRTSL